MIAGLLSAPAWRGSGSSGGGEGGAGDGDRGASLHEDAHEFQTDSAAMGGNNEEQQQ